jgi:hypothetical protein
VLYVMLCSLEGFFIAIGEPLAVFQIGNRYPSLLVKWDQPYPIGFTDATFGPRRAVKCCIVKLNVSGMRAPGLSLRPGYDGVGAPGHRVFEFGQGDCVETLLVVDRAVKRSELRTR